MQYDYHLGQWIAEDPPISYAAAMGYWLAAGGDPSVVHVAGSLPGPESSFIPNRIEQDQPADVTGWGLWQITPGYGNSAGNFEQLFDPLTNAKVAVSKYEGSIAAGRPGFEPWTTWTNGLNTPYIDYSVDPLLPGGHTTGVGGSPSHGQPGGNVSGGSTHQPAPASGGQSVSSPPGGDGGDPSTYIDDCFRLLWLYTQYGQNAIARARHRILGVAYVTAAGPQPQSSSHPAATAGQPTH